jgi:pimeloyl-ACP methyl ester carboxylesterase
VPPLPHVEGVAHRDVQLPGVRLHVAEAGAGEPVLLLHGWPQHWFEWRHVIGLLAGEFRLLAPDNRGFGWSEAPGAGYDPATFAADAVALLDALEIERAHVIGHDWGGFSGFLLGLGHPERVRGMVLCSTPHPWIPRTPGALAALWRTWYVLAMAAPGVGQRVARGRRIGRLFDLYGRPGTLTEAEKEVYLAPLRDPARARASTLLYRSYLRSAADSLGRGAYAGRRLSVPTRLLAGEQDAFIPRPWVEGLDHHADAGRLELVPGAGHWLPEERPELVAARARELFASA